MQKYFITKEELESKVITGDDVNHIKNVMRSKLGDRFIVSDEKDEYLVSISSLDKKSVSFEIVEPIDNKNEMPYIIDIFHGYPKGDKIEDIIKHSTELGVHALYPTLMKRSVVKLDSDRKESKRIRLSKIAKEAAEQSFRKYIPIVDILDFKKIDFSGYDKKIVAYEESARENDLSNFKEVIRNLKENERLAVVIGPEGGVDEDEIKHLESCGFIPCGLGPRILRTETAPMYVLSSISFEKELK